MKLTKAQLKHLIREELEAVLQEEELEEDTTPVVGQSRPATPHELSKRLPGTEEGHAFQQTVMPTDDGAVGFTPLRPKTQGVTGETTIGRRTAKARVRAARSLKGQPVALGTKVAGIGGKSKYPSQVTRMQAQTGGVTGPLTPHGTEVMNIASTGRANESLMRNLEQIVREAVERLFP
jgi:hypothetical protein